MSGYRKGVRGRADRMWSEYVRAIGYCQRCGGTDKLEAAHIIRRGYQGTRCDPDNGWCLCKLCHRMIDEWASQHAALVDETIGEVGLAALEHKAQASVGARFSDAFWRDVADELKRLRDERRTSHGW